MSKNKTGKYFKYAIGEIILVVIGILIALQINNWNENQKNNTKEQEYLIGLKNDLEKQILDLDVVKSFSDNINKQAEEILAEYTLKKSLKDIDSLNTKISQIMYSRNYPDIRTTFNELNSTGQLKLIRNKKLRSQIIAFYQLASKHYNSIHGNINEVFYPNVFPVLRASIIIQVKDFGYQPTTFNENNFLQNIRKQLKQDTYQQPSTFEIVNAVSTRVIIENSTVKYIEKSLEEAKSLLINLKTELINYND